MTLSSSLTRSSSFKWCPPEESSMQVFWEVLSFKALPVTWDNHRRCLSTQPFPTPNPHCLIWSYPSHEIEMRKAFQTMSSLYPAAGCRKVTCHGQGVIESGLPRGIFVLDVREKTKDEIQVTDSNATLVPSDLAKAHPDAILYPGSHKGREHRDEGPWIQPSLSGPGGQKDINWYVWWERKDRDLNGNHQEHRGTVPIGQR